MNFMQPVTASYTGHDLDVGFVPPAFRLHHSSEHTGEKKELFALFVDIKIFLCIKRVIFLQTKFSES